MSSRKPDAKPPLALPQDAPGTPRADFGEAVLRIELAAQDAVEEARLARGHFASERLERERRGVLRRFVAWLRRSP